MSFTIRDVIYLAVIALLTSFFLVLIKKEKLKVELEKTNTIIQNGIAAQKLDSANKSMLQKMDSISFRIGLLYNHRDQLKAENKKLENDIKIIKLNYEKNLIFIDTASVNDVIKYWSDELR